MLSIYIINDACVREHDYLKSRSKKNYKFVSKMAIVIVMQQPKGGVLTPKTFKLEVSC